MAMKKLVAMHAEAMRTLDSVFLSASMDAVHSCAAIRELVAVLCDLKDGTLSLADVDLSWVPEDWRMKVVEARGHQRNTPLEFTTKIVKDFLIPDGVAESPPEIDADAMQKDRGSHVTVE